MTVKNTRQNSRQKRPSKMPLKTTFKLNFQKQHSVSHSVTIYCHLTESPKFFCYKPDKVCLRQRKVPHPTCFLVLVWIALLKFIKDNKEIIFQPKHVLFNTMLFIVGVLRRRGPTGGFNIGQLTWNEPNKWLVPLFLCYHIDQDSYDGWRKNDSLS